MVNLNGLEAYGGIPLTLIQPERQDPVVVKELNQSRTLLQQNHAERIAGAAEALSNIEDFLSQEPPPSDDDVRGYVVMVMEAIYGQTIDPKNNTWDQTNSFVTNTESIGNFLRGLGEGGVNFGKGVFQNWTEKPIVFSKSLEEDLLKHISEGFGLPTSGTTNQEDFPIVDQWGNIVSLLYGIEGTLENGDEGEESASDPEGSGMADAFPKFNSRSLLALIQGSLAIQLNESLEASVQALEELTEVSSGDTGSSSEDIGALLASIEAGQRIAKRIAQEEFSATTSYQPEGFEPSEESIDLSSVSITELMGNYGAVMAALLGEEKPVSTASRGRPDAAEQESPEAEPDTTVESSDSAEMESESSTNAEDVANPIINGQSNLTTLLNIQLKEEQSDILDQDTEEGSERPMALVEVDQLGNFTINQAAIEEFIARTIYNASQSESMTQDEAIRELVKSYNTTYLAALEEGWNNRWSGPASINQSRDNKREDIAATDGNNFERFYTVDPSAWKIKTHNGASNIENGSVKDMWGVSFGASRSSIEEEQSSQGNSSTTEAPDQEERAEATETSTSTLEEDKLFQLSLTNIETYIRLLKEQAEEQNVGNMVRVVGTGPVSQAALPQSEPPATAPTPPAAATSATPAATSAQQLPQVPTAPVPAPVPQS